MHSVSLAARDMRDSAIDSYADEAARWLADFERALARGDKTALEALFADECHWRDLMAFTWTIGQREGKTPIVEGLVEAQPGIKARSFTVSHDRTAPRRVKRVGVEVVEAIFSFETEAGRGYGLVRLPTSAPGQAWVLMTSLHELKGHEEPINDRRPTGSAYSRNFGGDNWADQRRREEVFADREPAVLVVGAGQAGLGVAARLRLLGVDTLVVEKNDRVGDNWRNRYHSLALHNELQLNHLPYIPYPPSWPKYLPKDMLAGWFEAYAWAMELNVWTGTTLVSGRYDDDAGQWIVKVRRADGTERALRPRHLVFANGVNGVPRYLKLPGVDDFSGEVMHSHAYRDGSEWKGKRALVIGTGNSGHDVAQDLYSHGATVSLVQRGSTTVVSIDSAHFNHALYSEGLPIEDADLIATASTYPLLVRGFQLNVKKMVERDKDLIAGLAAKGFKQDLGEDQTGHQMKLRRRGGGYYLNAGCSDLIIEGEIGLLQYDDIERFVADGALMKDGLVEKAELVVTASGYYPPQELVRQLLGDEVADRVGPVWGVGSDGEMNNMYKPTAQKGLWFMGGGLAHCRIYSKLLALQIKAREAGFVS